WRDAALVTGGGRGAALHLDTGMTRLGLDPEETAWLLRRIEDGEAPLAGIDVELVMSHLTAGEDLADESSDRQLASFARLRGWRRSAPLPFR
ncbi:MAG: alanine racemase, partial [Rhodobiaceae bacterium]